MQLILQTVEIIADFIKKIKKLSIDCGMNAEKERHVEKLEEQKDLSLDEYFVCILLIKIV